MKIKEKEVDFNYVLKSVFCIGVGTAAGLLVYAFFLYFNIAIVGWNLGLIFAPLGAGYAETVLANRLLGKNLGAISAFILFIDTTFYSFILKNPTLGMNIITAGSIIVILQAAFPTLINYILLVIIGGTISNFKWVAKKIKEIFKLIISHIRWETPDSEIEEEEIPYFDEMESNDRINNLNFFFITSTDMKTRNHDILGIYFSEVILDNKHAISKDYDNRELERLVNIKKGKDECLIKLVNVIKENGGNGVLDLDIKYGMVGLGGDCMHITATGMGIFIR